MPSPPREELLEIGAVIVHPGITRGDESNCKGCWGIYWTTYFACAAFIAQLGIPSGGGLLEFLTCPSSRSRSLTFKMCCLKSSTASVSFDKNWTASKRALMAGMLWRGRHIQWRNSLLPPALSWHNLTFFQVSHSQKCQVKDLLVLVALVLEASLLTCVHIEVIARPRRVPETLCTKLMKALKALRASLWLSAKQGEHKGVSCAQWGWLWRLLTSVAGLMSDRLTSWGACIQHWHQWPFCCPVLSFQQVQIVKGGAVQAQGCLKQVIWHNLRRLA